MATTKTPSPSNSDYENLGKSLTKVLTPDLLEIIQSKRKMFWISAIRGAGVAVGGVVGLAVFALIIAS